MMGRAKGKASTDCADAREEDREAHEWTLKRGGEGARAVDVDRGCDTFDP